MADQFIDQDETQIYGPYTARLLRARLAAEFPEFTAGITKLADELDAATAVVKTAIDTARDKDASLRKGTSNKHSVLRQAKRLLGRFSRHLDSHSEGRVDRKVFFTKDGTATSIGNGAANILLAVTHIAGQLDRETSVNDRERWRAEFLATMQALSPVVEFADDTRTDRRNLTPEVTAARDAWLQIYLATRSMVEGLLRLQGKLRLLPTYFYDLTVTPGTQLKTPPPDPPLEPEESNEPDSEDEE